MKIHLPIKQLFKDIPVERCDVDGGFVVHDIASLADAGFSDVAVVLDRGDASVFDAINKEAIKQSAAGVILAQQADVDGKKYILVQDPLAVFTELVEIALLQEEWMVGKSCIGQNVKIHPTATIDAGATIGDGAYIGANVYIGKSCQIGSNVKLYPGVKVLDRCVIGNRSIIHSGAVIGSDGFGYQVSKAGLRKIPQIGIVNIGNDVEIGANSTLDRAGFGQTILADGVKLDNTVHVAHGVSIGACTAILAQTCIGGSTEIGRGCQIGGQVAIKDHLKIGNGVKIVSKSAVMNNLEDGQIVAGIPAIPFNQWKRLTVSLQKVPDILKNIEQNKVYDGATKTWWQRLFQ